MTHPMRQRWRAFTPWQRTLASASGAMLIGWSALLLSPAARRSTSSHAPIAPVAEEAAPRVEPAGATPPPATARTAGPSQPVADAALTALRSGLASDNAGTRIEALRAAADQQLTQALPELLQRDLGADPDSAPTLIQVCAALAQHAQPAQRSATLRQLSAWLNAEVARTGDAARGDVSVLVETLGRWPDREVVPVLADTLQNPGIPLHVQTLAVEGLGRLRAGSARAALGTFRARIAQSPPHGGFELELHQEALQAADRALAKLPSE